MSNDVQNLLKKGAPEFIPTIEGTIEAVYKEDDRFRFVGKTRGDINISVDVEPGEMFADIGGIVIQVKGGHAEINESRFAVYNGRDGAYAELDVEPESRFKLKFELKR